jgi:hypothetical protein
LEGDCHGCGPRERTDESVGGGGGGAIGSGHLGRGKGGDGGEQPARGGGKRAGGGRTGGKGEGGETAKQQTDASVKRDLVQCQKRPCTVSKETEKQQTDAMEEDSRKTKVLFNLDSHLATPEAFSSVDAVLLHLQAVLDDGGHIFLVHALN